MYSLLDDRYSKLDFFLPIRITFQEIINEITHFQKYKKVSFVCYKCLEQWLHINSLHYCSV